MHMIKSLNALTVITTVIPFLVSVAWVSFMYNYQEQSQQSSLFKVHRTVRWNELLGFEHFYDWLMDQDYLLNYQLSD